MHDQQRILLQQKRRNKIKSNLSKSLKKSEENAFTTRFSSLKVKPRVYQDANGAYRLDHSSTDESSTLPRNFSPVEDLKFQRGTSIVRSKSEAHDENSSFIRTNTISKSHTQNFAHHLMSTPDEVLLENERFSSTNHSLINPVDSIEITHNQIPKQYLPVEGLELITADNILKKSDDEEERPHRGRTSIISRAQRRAMWEF